MTMTNFKTFTAAALLALGSMSCSSELTDSAAPVEFVVTHTQDISLFDLNPPPDDDSCDGDFGTINMDVIPKNDSATGPFLQVRATTYRVSYTRTDGGTQVPAPFVRSMDTLVGPDGAQGSGFIAFEPGALTQAPFAALQPQNGGRDLETGKAFVGLNIKVEVFGETLNGDNVSDSTTIPMEVCFGCGGCA
jgi:hypothetical protein